MYCTRMFVNKLVIKKMEERRKKWKVSIKNNPWDKEERKIEKNHWVERGKKIAIGIKKHEQVMQVYVSNKIMVRGRVRRRIRSYMAK